MFNWIAEKIFGVYKAKTVPEFFRGCWNPRQVADRIAFNIFYKTDVNNYGLSEYWATPFETAITHRDGDCEDMALLAKEGLRLIGVASRILCVYCPRFGHAVCVFEKHGKYVVIDCTQRNCFWYKETDIPVGNEEELAKMILSDVNRFHFELEPIRYGNR